MINPVNPVFRGIKRLFGQIKTPYFEKVTESCTFIEGNEFTRKVNLVREYENPNAKAILKQIRALRFPLTKDKDEFIRLNEELGSSRLRDPKIEKKLKKITKSS